ncbi:MAG: integrase arm-type DNA-binding domain-containing protein [Acetobacteraceae bacterium]|jgi:integrase
MTKGRLSVTKLAALLKAGEKRVVGDGDNLYLQVTGAGNGSWLYRYAGEDGKDHWMGLGDVGKVGLGLARRKRDDQHRLRGEGKDPLAERRAEKTRKKAEKIPPFRVLAEQYIRTNIDLLGGKSPGQWRQSLTDYAYPVIGDLPPAAITTDHVMKVVEPEWLTKNVTIDRVRNRIEKILESAKTRGFRTGDNPARWKDHLENLLPKKSRVATVEHFAALPWREIGVFMAELREEEAVAAIALEFDILTSSRPSETIGALWSEIDMANALWTIPAERMKFPRERRVPLSNRCMTILRQMDAMRDGDFVFPGSRAGAPMAGRAFLALLERMGRSVTAHGFRSTFRDWAGETGQPNDIAEVALAHAVGTKVQATYQRGDLLERRRHLMEAWAAFCEGPMGADVIPLRVSA